MDICFQSLFWFNQFYFNIFIVSLGKHSCKVQFVVFIYAMVLSMLFKFNLIINKMKIVLFIYIQNSILNGMAYMHFYPI